MKLSPLRMEFFLGKENEAERCCGQEEFLRLPEEGVCLLEARETKQEGQQERLRVDNRKLSSGQE